MAIRQFKLGTEASCTDGVCGVLVRILLDPRPRKVTNLMIEPRGRVGLGRLVPLSLVDLGRSTGGDLWLKCEVVPPGEKEVEEHEPARASDGEIGHLHGLLANTDNGDVTALLFQVGHLWGHKVVAIPISAVVGFETDIPLSLSQQEVLNLPAFDDDAS
jgi:hypothetical protein